MEKSAAPSAPRRNIFDKPEVKIFRPKKKPRYIYGQVDRNKVESDLKEYNNHLYKVFFAHPKIDTRPPPFKAKAYLKIMNISADAFTLRRIALGNQSLVQKINYINRNGGNVDSFNPGAFARLSNWQMKKKDFRQLTKENRNFYHRIVNCQSLYKNSDMQKHWKKVLKGIHLFAKFPVTIFQKPTKDEEILEYPSMSAHLNLEPIERPKVIIEMKMVGSLKLGRMTIELFVDVEPEAVIRFLTYCRKNKGFPVFKVYKNNYCLMGDNLNIKNLQVLKYKKEDKRYLLHTKPGVLSMIPSPEHLGSSFAITFSPHQQFDKKLIAFGRVFKGAANLFKLNDLGTQFGRSITKVIVSDFKEIKNKKFKFDLLREDEPAEEKTIVPSEILEIITAETNSPSHVSSAEMETVETLQLLVTPK